MTPSTEGILNSTLADVKHRLREVSLARRATEALVPLIRAQVHNILDMDLPTFRAWRSAEPMRVTRDADEDSSGTFVYAVFNCVPDELVNEIDPGEIVKLDRAMFDGFAAWACREATQEEQDAFDAECDRRLGVTRFMERQRRIALLNRQ